MPTQRQTSAGIERILQLAIATERAALHFQRRLHHRDESALETLSWLRLCCQSPAAETRSMRAGVAGLNDYSRHAVTERAAQQCFAKDRLNKGVPVLAKDAHIVIIRRRMMLGKDITWVRHNAVVAFILWRCTGQGLTLGNSARFILVSSSRRTAGERASSSPQRSTRLSCQRDRCLVADSHLLRHSIPGRQVPQ